MKKIYCDPSPCKVCSRVKDPENCENKNCKVWRDWFCERWELIHRFPRVMMENMELKPAGVKVGGRVYPAPHQVEEYQKSNPCDKCLCPKDLCKSPCKLRRQWLKGERQ